MATRKSAPAGEAAAPPSSPAGAQETSGAAAEEALAPPSGDKDDQSLGATAIDQALAAMRQAEAMVQAAGQLAGFPLGTELGETQSSNGPLNDLITAAVHAMTDGAEQSVSATASAIRELTAAHVQALSLYNALAQQQADAIAGSATATAAAARLLAGGHVDVQALRNVDSGEALGRLRTTIDTILSRAAVTPVASAEPSSAA